MIYIVGALAIIMIFGTVGLAERFGGWAGFVGVIVTVALGTLFVFMMNSSAKQDCEEAGFTYYTGGSCSYPYTK